MSALTGLTLAAARDGLAKGDFTSVELTQAHIAAVEAARPLNAYTCETPEKALAMAAESDKRIAAGKAGAMEGLPVAIRDLFCTDGVLSAAGSHILDGCRLAMGSSNMTSHYGAVENPWKRNNDPKTKLVPGGSSGGSAAAVAARAALAATGTDTGGSIGQPASFTGIVGMKPTYGRCSRWGIIAFASSLDQAGPMTRSVRDAAIMLGAMAGFDPMDSTSVDTPVPDYEAALSGDIKGLKIGIPKEYRMEGTPPEIETLWQQGADWLRDAGAEIVEVTLPHTKYALPAYYIVAPAEASSNLARYDGVRYGLRVPGNSLQEMYENTRAEGFGQEVKRRVLIGTYVLSAGYYDAYYLKAQKVRSRIAGDFRDAWDRVDLLLAPTAPNAAFGQGEKMDDPIAMYLNDVFTVPASLAGLPAISVPAGLSAEGLPLGLQLIGRPFDEETVLRAAHVLEGAAGFEAMPDFIAGG
jgi:aspartyl-tRNA(Asn)/glutamyl-tRNA(Gln) amidotransferase subunit A